VNALGSGPVVLLVGIPRHVALLLLGARFAGALLHLLDLLLRALLLVLLRLALRVELLHLELLGLLLRLHLLLPQGLLLLHQLHLLQLLGLRRLRGALLHLLLRAQGLLLLQL